MEKKEKITLNPTHLNNSPPSIPPKLTVSSQGINSKSGGLDNVSTRNVAACTGMNPLFPPPVKQIRLDIPGFMKISKVSRKKCLPRPRIPAGRRLRESRARASLSFLPPSPGS